MRTEKNKTVRFGNWLVKYSRRRKGNRLLGRFGPGCDYSLGIRWGKGSAALSIFAIEITFWRLPKDEKYSKAREVLYNAKLPKEFSVENANLYPPTEIKSGYRSAHTLGQALGLHYKKDRAEELERILESDK